MPKRNRPIRNHVAQSPLLRKGGVHIKSKTGTRVQARRLTDSAIEEWQDEIDDTNNEYQQESGQQARPGFFT